ncbi:hypothetical protein JCM11491_002076 [Sporobolomyces phaffii]
MSRPRKKVRTGDQSSAIQSLPAQVAHALDKLIQLDQVLASLPRSTAAEVHDAVSDASEALGPLEITASAARLGVDAIRARELEAVGKKLWNRSRTAEEALRKLESDAAGLEQAGDPLIPRLRHLALRTIRVSSTPAETIEQTLSLFELTTQTASSFLASNNTALLRTFESEAADLGDAFKDLSQLETHLHARCVLATLDFLVYRTRLSLSIQPSASNGWIRGKIKTLVEHERGIPGRKIQDIAESAYRSGTSLASRAKECDENAALLQRATEWLEWAHELVQLRADEITQALKVAILKCLAFTQLQVDERRRDGEATYKKLIQLESTFAHKRQLLAMILARQGSDSEIMDAFANLVADAVHSEEEGLAVAADISRLPETRRNLRLRLIQTLLEALLSGWSSANHVNASNNPAHLLEQLLSLAAINVKLQDFEYMSAMFKIVMEALEVVRILVHHEPEPDQDFHRSLTWIRLAAVEFVAIVAQRSDPIPAPQFYETISSFAELEQTIAGPSRELLLSLFTCRLAALAAHASAIRGLNPEDRSKQYASLLDRVGAFQTELAATRSSQSGHFPESEHQKLVNAAISLQAECHAALSHWEDLLHLIGLFENDDSPDESSLIAIRLVADKVSTGTECPYGILRSVYRQTLAILYKSRALDPSQMAVWLRMISQVLLVREPDEAFKYLKNAQQLVANNHADYPAEEISWLISTARDQGLEIYSSDTASPNKYAKWCQLAITIAYSAHDQALAQQLEEWHAGLQEQYGRSDTIALEG